MKLDNRINTALLVIDVQEGLFQKTTPIYKADELLYNINSRQESTQRWSAGLLYSTF